MRIISHRGRLKGDEGLDNNPTQIEKCISLGYDVEIDLNSDLFLGHDVPEFKINKEWLFDLKYSLWIHCKDLSALDFCLQNNLHCFYHETDKVTLTSKGYIWTFPQESYKIYNNQVILDFSETPKKYDCYAMCLDYI